MEEQRRGAGGLAPPKDQAGCSEARTALGSRGSCWLPKPVLGEPMEQGGVHPDPHRRPDDAPCSPELSLGCFSCLQKPSRWKAGRAL